MKTNELYGKTIVITGASSGVGLATAEAFAQEGCHLVLAARGQAGLDAAVERCRKLGGTAVGIPTDVSDYAQVQHLLAETLARTGRVDVWVNNAGVMASGKFEEIPIELSQQVVKTNLLGYMNCTHVVLPVFKSQQEGVLVNNVSIGGFMPAPYSAVYSSTKFGIKGMMECLQGEISNEPDIHICNLYPQIQRSTGNMHSAKYSGLDFKIPPFAADPRDTAAQLLSLAKNPKKNKFPDFNSWLLKTMHDFAPNLLVNTASAGMRLLMKWKNAPSTEGNILTPSKDPHEIYGESILPVQVKSSKMVLGIGLAVAAILLASRASGKD